MQPIRILQVLTIMNRGGAETMVMNYYRNIDRSKVQFDFLLHRDEPGIFEEEIIALGGKIHRLQPINMFDLSGYMKALDNFFKSNPEYKIVHAHLNALSVFVLRAAKKNNIPVRIAHSHTSMYHINLNPFSRDRHSFGYISKFIVQNLFKQKIPLRANHYFSCGEKAGKWLFGKRNLKKVSIIHNAIDADKFLYDKDKAVKVKSDLKISDKLVVGHVGNFVFEKNHPFIIKVFRELKKKKENVVLVLVGAGKRDHIESLAKTMGVYSDILFLGVRNDVPDLMQAMDVFLFPSTNEGLPVTLIEAQASGLKILASTGVSSEIDITGLAQFESLKTSPELWADTLLESSNYNRINTKEKIAEHHYDIENNALFLQNFYLNQLK